MKIREIERKFLVKRLPAVLKRPRGELIDQGYLVTSNQNRHVRLRRKGRTTSLTFKDGSGLAREEREIALSAKQFAVLWPATKHRRLRKIRHEVKWKGLVIEIDSYRGANRGLVVAEVEFPTLLACRKFKPPKWFGREVTGNKRYSNIRLATE